MKNIGEKIKESRILKGLTQEELAELSKMNLRTIQRIENNENKPRGKSLLLISEVLNLNLEELIEKENKNENKAIVTKLINGAFLIVLNLALISTFGYLTIDSETTIHSRTAAILLSFLIPYFIITKSRNMNNVERLIKFGIGLFIYTIVIATKISFPSLFLTGLLPCLIILLGTLFYGNKLISKNEKTLHNTGL